jgi:glycine cleavage system H lipoate-binding protein
MLNGQEYLSPTGERVLISGDVAHVGAGDAIQDYTGKLLCLHVVKPVGALVRRGDAVIAAEGAGGAVELYAPCDGTIVWTNAAPESAPRWLFKLRIAPA